MGRPLKKDAYDSAPRNLGRYRLHGEIASGGMATVHFGRQVGSGGFAKTVAIKRLHPQFGKMPEFVSMFLAEARLAARIRHPNVVQPLDVLTVDSELFLVMEYVDGDSLSRLMRSTLARKERVPLPIAVSILCGVLHGLHAAHEAKNDRGEPLELVHRDVSPQNVLVGVDGAARVIDFGIAKAADSVQFTRDGELKGKLSYMAPEQLNGHRCTRRSDIYAASVVLWEVLTAQRLFDADYQSAILKNILHRPVDPPSDVVQDLPKVLDQIVLKGLARDPSDRFATARDMALALEESVPLATQSSVGSWVELVAAKNLATRAARVAEIESVPSTSPEDDSENAEEIFSEMLVPVRAPIPSASSVTPPPVPGATPPPSGRRSLPEPIGSPFLPAPSAAQPDVGLPFAPTQALSAVPAPPLSPSAITQPPGSTGRVSAPPPSVRSRPKAPERADTSVLNMPPPASSPSTKPSVLAATVSSARPPPPTINVVDESSMAPQWPVPGIAPAPQGIVATAAPTKASHSGGGMIVLLLFLMAGVAGFFIVLPEFVRRGYVSGAERTYGAALTIGQVQVSMRQIRLVGVSATLREVPGVNLEVGSIDMPLSGLSPTEMTAHDVVLNVDGPYPAMTETFARWSKAHVRPDDKSSSLKAFHLDSGHFIWTRAFGEQTKLEAENVSGDADVVEGRALGDDFAATASIFDIVLPTGKLGPWQVKVESTNRLGKVTVGFDPSGASRAQAVVTVKEGNVTAIEGAVPRTPIGQLGLNAGVLGLHQDQPVFLEGEAHYALYSGPRAQGKLRLAATGVRVNSQLTLTEADVDLRFDGDPSHPIELGESSIVVGAFRARPTGTITFGDGFLRADLAWLGGNLRCAGGGEQTLGTTLHLDSHALDGASWIVGGHRCPKGGQ